MELDDEMLSPSQRQVRVQRPEEDGWVVKDAFPQGGCAQVCGLVQSLQEALDKSHLPCAALPHP